MRVKSHWFISVGILVAVALVGVSCDEELKQIRFGGWIPVYDGQDIVGQATFGGKGSCEELPPSQIEKLLPGETEGVKITLRLQYQDHTEWNGYHVKFHGELVAFAPGSCTGYYSPTIYAGLYQPIPWGQFKDDPNSTGILYVGVEDNGEPGVSSDDSFAIALDGGAFDGYENYGSLGGGNIQVFDK